jgi:hypothetical protein
MCTEPFDNGYCKNGLMRTYVPDESIPIGALSQMELHGTYERPNPQMSNGQ